jgi:hypothetical protein
MSEVIMKEGEDVLVFLLMLYWESVCWICHFVPWRADYMYVGRALFKDRVGCKTGVQLHN